MAENMNGSDGTAVPSEPIDMGVLVEAARVDVRALADQLEPRLRQRLLTVAHVLGLVGRELAAETGKSSTGGPDADELALTSALLNAATPVPEIDVIARLRPVVSARLDIDSPGYAG